MSDGRKIDEKKII